MANYFNKFIHIDWGKVALFVTAFTAAWIAMAELIPPHAFKVVAVVLGALSAFLGIITRGTKYVETRTDVAVAPNMFAPKR